MNSTGITTAAMLEQSRRAYASGAVLRQLGEDVDPSTFAELVAATEIRLRFLGESLAAERPAIFEDHMRWTRIVHEANANDPQVVESNLVAIASELEESLPAASGDPAAECVRLGLEAFRASASETTTHLPDDMPHVAAAREYLVAVLEARISDAVTIIDDLLDGGADAGEVVSSVVVGAQREIGRLWQIGDATVADEHLSSRTAEQVIASVHARVKKSDVVPGRRVLFAAGEGDPHDLGQRIASLFFLIDGWQPLVFGASMPGVSLVRAIEDYQADVVALSLQIGLHVRATANLVASIRESCDVPVLIGGRMIEVVPDLWQVVGADGGAVDARGAVRVAAELVGKRS